jgi:hypothetical protein
LLPVDGTATTLDAHFGNDDFVHGGAFVRTNKIMVR